MNRQVLNFMIAYQFFGLAFITRFDISQHLQITESDSPFKKSSKDIILLVKCEIHNECMVAIGLQLKVIDECEVLVINTNDIRASLKQIITLISDHRHYLFDTVDSPRINHRCYLILIGYLRVSCGDDLILLKDLILVVRLIDPPNVLNDILCKL